MTETRTVHRICTLCEATCGITVEARGNEVVSIRGDKDDPFSRGYICPKATGMKGLYEDPDRLRAPIRKTADGGWEEISWDEAFSTTIERLTAVRETHGANGIGTYVGNPSAHSLHAMMYGPVLWRALGTKQRFSASSADQLPKMVSAGLMFGGGLTIPVPDLDRTDYLIVMGGNPLASNGSLMTAPDVPTRLKDIAKRGGKLVVIDPRRSETAGIASEHHFIKPGTDTFLLLAMLHVMYAEDRIDLGRAKDYVINEEQIRGLVADFTPELAAEQCGIDADTIRRLTREFCAADKAACYGRIGTTCQEFGTLASWAVDLVNTLSGNLDKPGGAMFTKTAANNGYNRNANKVGGRGVSLNRWQSRVKGLPEMFGEIPVSTMVDEMTTEGEGQVRALVTMSGNPVISAPNAQEIDEALAGLDFMVSIDFYINETTRHADIILPPPSALERDTYDIALYNLAVRDVAKYSEPVFDPPEGQPNEWEILLTIAKGMMGMGDLDLHSADDFVLSQVAAGEIGDDGGQWDGLTLEEATEKLGTVPGPGRILDLLLRTGAYGDGFGRKPDGLSLQKLKDNPHGVDLGPLKERLPEVLRTPDAKIDMAPASIVDDLQRLRGALTRNGNGMVLIGRRHLRSNNSWCHNLENLVRGRDRCTLMVSEDDAQTIGLETGGLARVTSRVGSVVAPVEVTDEMMPGVVSLPHGWGHDVDGVQMDVAKAYAGVNVNILSDNEFLDELSGNAAFNGVPVEVVPMT